MKRIFMLGMALAFAGLLPASAAPQKDAKAPAVELRSDNGAYMLSAKDATIGEILDQLKKQSSVDIDVPQEILGQRITIELTNVTEEDLISVLAGSNALIYERSGNGYRLVSAHLTSQQAYVAPTMPAASKSEKKSIQALVAQVRSLLDEHRKIIGYAGELNYDQAKALIADRKAKMQAIVDQLAALGPGGSRAMSEAYAGTTGIREREAMIEALGRIGDEEASLVLGALFGNEPSFSLRREIVGSLGSRKDAATEEVLASILKGSEDVRMDAAAVQAMAGRTGSLESLTQLIGTTTQSLDVRQEGIRSVGAIGSDAARNVLSQTALSATDVQVRKAAIQELSRSFGEAALPTLEVLLSDGDEAIRNNAVKAVSRISTDAATTILQNAAHSDVSPTVRSQAEAALATRGTNG